MKKWLLPLLFFALLAPFTPQLDHYFASLAYGPDCQFHNGFIIRFLYKYGEIFGIATGGVALGIYLGSFWRPKWKKMRKGALVMALTLIIGAGIITNGLLKEFWGRPRPKQVIEYGGKHVYRPFWQPNFHTRHDPQKSFPSGHAAMGFYFLSMCLVGKRYNHKEILITGIALTVVLGGGLMVGRVVQGGHFASDVMASLVLMWLVSLAIEKSVFTWGAGAAQIDRCPTECDTCQECDEPSTAS